MFSARLLARLGLCATLLGLLGCGEDLSPLSIGLDFRQQVPGQCPNQTCDSYGMDCGAVVSVRVFPGDSDPLTSTAPLAESCVEVPASANLCALTSADLGLREVPAERVRIEVAVWAPEDLQGTCPSGPMFDLGGLPLTTFDPQPAFAGSRIVDASSSELSIAEIQLACFDQDPLGQCGGGETDVFADIDDLDTLIFAPPPAAANLLVTVGSPIAQPGTSGDTIHVIGAADDYLLELTRAVPVPQFSASVPRTFTDTACILVLDLSPQSTTAVTCTSVSSGLARLDLKGYLVGKPRIDGVLAAIGETGFLERGLVVGRVVDDLDQPAAGVTVSAETPTGGQAEVLYIDESFTGANNTGPTASHGFFVSRDAPFGTRWTAEHTDGRREALAPLTGLIQSKVTALVIPLSGT